MLDITNSVAEPVGDSTPLKRGPFNRTAIKRHLLVLSYLTRNGKFTRVSDVTITEITAIAENKIREMYSVQFRAVGPCDTLLPKEDFLTGEGMTKLAEAFNIWLAREMQRRVNDTRTGVTL